jgi:ribosomal protein S12 methylthiotransferase
VLIDQVEGDRAVGRSRGDAPEIDGTVTVSAASGLHPGDLVVVQIEGADEHDLFGSYLGQRLEID